VALLALATRDNLVAPDVASFLISMTIVSMALTPFLISHADSWASWLMKRFEKTATSIPTVESKLSADTHRDHVVILGFGRVGQTIARFLRSVDIDYLALETDSVRISEASAAGEPVFYGDSSRKDILKSAGVANASLLVISFDDARQTKHILHLVKELNPDLKVLARTRDDSDLEAILAAGATEVVPETLEASLTLVSHVLVLLGLPAQKIHALVDKSRQDRYRMLHGFYHGQRVAQLDSTSEVLHAVPINEGSWVCGKKLADINWPVNHNPVSELKRDGRSYYLSDLADDDVQPGDVILLSGRIEELERCEALLLTGHK